MFKQDQLLVARKPWAINEHFNLITNHIYNVSQVNQNSIMIFGVFEVRAINDVYTKTVSFINKNDANEVMLKVKGFEYEP